MHYIGVLLHKLYTAKSNKYAEINLIEKSASFRLSFFLQMECGRSHKKDEWGIPACIVWYLSETLLLVLLDFSLQLKMADWEVMNGQIYCPPAIFDRKFRVVIRCSLCLSASGMLGPESISLLGGSFSFFVWNLPMMIHQKPIFQIFEKSNMAAILTIINNNLQLKYRKVCADRNLWGRSFSFSTWN